MITALSNQNRALAMYLALSLLILSPFQVMAQNPTDMGVKTLMLGGLAGVGGLFALKAMIGPSTAVGSMAAAGTGVFATVGRGLGAVMSGVSSLASTLATGAKALFAGAGSLMGSGFSALTRVVSSPYFLVPAALIGGGLLVYHFYKQSQDPAGNLPGVRKLGFFERFRSMAIGGGQLANGYGSRRPLPPSAYNTGLYSGMNQFYNGGPAAFSTAGVQDLGGFGATTSTDPVGITALGETAPAALDSQDPRANLHPSSPEDTAALQDRLRASEIARSEAYNRLVTSLKGSRGSETGSSNMVDDDVQEAIRDYKQAHQEIQELRGLLGQN